jgi:hypothetical protein
VQVWTVNTEADARRLLSWGADALITDRPDVIVPFVQKHFGGLVHSAAKGSTTENTDSDGVHGH